MKKKQVKKIEIPVQIYRMSVVVFFGATMNEIIKWGIKNNIQEKRFTDEWKKWVGDTIKEQPNGFAINYGDNNRDILIWLKKQPKVSSEFGWLYHELYHAVYIISI